MKNFLIYIFCQLLVTNLYAQPTNDSCVNALIVCSLLVTEGSTNQASLENCNTLGGCADDFPNFGITPLATVWYKFTTNSTGGIAVIDFTNLQFNTDPTYGQTLQAMLFNVPVPCQGEDFTLFSNVETGATTDFTITSITLLPNTTYYLVVNGAITGVATVPASATFDLAISGSAINVPTLPTATISVSNTEICQGETEPITVDIINCSQSISNNWYYNNSLSIDSIGFNTSSLLEDGYLKLIVSCGNECVYNVTTDSIYFEITPIEVDAGEDKLIELGESVVLNGSGTSNPVWTPATSLIPIQSFTPTANPTVTTTYFLTVTNENCMLTDEMVVKIKEIITIPKGFTPNGDLANDIWEIVNISQYPNNSVIIYDRAGQEVFKTIGYNIGNNYWDGTNNGKDLPVSTYFYVIDLRNGNDDSIFKGPITIIR
jgi:gliding motility-associated-like protein